jgi:hypothetical protein
MLAQRPLGVAALVLEQDVPGRPHRGQRGNEGGNEGSRQQAVHGGFGGSPSGYNILAQLHSKQPQRVNVTQFSNADYDRAAEWGLVFTYASGRTGELYFPEIMGGGVALFDYDNDGDLDVFLVQGQTEGPGATLTKTGSPLKGRLYRNDLDVHSDGTRSVRFTDVTESSGIRATGYGMGVATGDYDNDGCIDLYVTTLGRNQLFRNKCDGTF